MGERVLVLSDRHPPRHAGGAELSLALSLAALRGIAPDTQIAVAALDAGTEPASAPRPDACGHLPFAGSYPDLGWVPDYYRLPGMSTARWLLRRSRQLYRVHARITPDRALARVTVDCAAHALWNEGGRYHLVADLIHHSRALPALAGLLARVRPTLVHADNFLAIHHLAMLRRLGLALPPCLGFVRDFRFVTPPRPVPRIALHRQASRNGALRPLRRTLLHLADRQDRATARAALQSMDGLAAASRFACRQTTALTGRRIHLVPNPALHQRTAGSPRDPEPLIAVCSAIIAPRKGQDLVLRAAERAFPEHPRARLVFTGESRSEGRSIVEAIPRSPIRDRIRLTGLIGHAATVELMGRARVVVSPGRLPEYFGRVVVEAAQHQTPCIAAADGAHPELITHDRNGWLFPPGDVAALAEILRRILAHPDLATAAGEHAAEEIGQRFPPERSATALLDAWQTTCQT
ncbi:MAG: glycosyltransferase family 4 protein [Planctomycetota bacterium]